MNKEKFAKFILELRKEKNMTQQEVADYLYVSDKAVSKWERAICLPDVTLFSRIAELFDITVAELISGEKISNGNKVKKVDEILIDNIKYEKKINKRKNRIITGLIILIFLFLFIFFAFFFFKNYNNIVSFSFQGDSPNFRFIKGATVLSRKNYMLEIGNFEIKENSNFDTDKVSNLEIKVYIDGNKWSFEKYDKEAQKKFTISEWLKNEVYFREETASECMLSDYKCGGTYLNVTDKNKFPNNLKIEITYCLDKDCKSEIFEIYYKEIASNKVFD